MGKHAYLIIAHNDQGLLNTLLRIVDDSRNDIFLHIDKKSKEITENELYTPRFSQLFCYRAINVNWGGDSQIKCELFLMNQAIRENTYQYYHLLSGQDLPIKSQDYIHSFFANRTSNYIVNYSENINNVVRERMYYYNYFQNLIGRNNGKLIHLYSIINNTLLKIQRNLSINRTQSINMKIYKGGNWFSLTHEAVLLILNSRNNIKKYFYHTLCCDELFIQTILMNSNMAATVVNDNLRYVDWKRGSPYTFKNTDYDDLMNNPNLFARKFSSYVDTKIIDKIKAEIIR